MSNRTILALLISLSLAPAVRAADEPTTQALEVAQATTSPSVAATPTESKPVFVEPHGTQRGVRAAAEQGPDALRRYIDRTRMIYGYRFQDYAKAEWYR